MGPCKVIVLLEYINANVKVQYTDYKTVRDKIIGVFEGKQCIL